MVNNYSGDWYSGNTLRLGRRVARSIRASPTMIDNILCYEFSPSIAVVCHRLKAHDGNHYGTHYEAWEEWNEDGTVEYYWPEEWKRRDA